MPQQVLPNLQNTTQICFARAPRMRIVNVRTGRSVKMQFNPNEFTEAIGVTYARQTVPGLSHQVIQFVNTDNRIITVELFFENANYPSKTRGVNPMLIIRRFLRSLVYPRFAGGGLSMAGAPRVLFLWPGFVSITAVITKLDFAYTHFSLKGEPGVMTASVELEEIRDNLLLSEDVVDLEGE